jgi:hypothetical protein
MDIISFEAARLLMNKVHSLKEILVDVLLSIYGG